MPVPDHFVGTGSKPAQKKGVRHRVPGRNHQQLQSRELGTG